MRPTHFLSVPCATALAAGVLLLASSASAGSNWQLSSFRVQPADAAKVAAAADKLLASEVGKQFAGKVMLLQYVANGSDPATHAFVSLYKSVAEREAYSQKLLATPAWSEFQAALSGISQPVAQIRYTTLKSWGELADADVVWEGHAFDVTDAAAFLAALDKFMASETGKKFPGQVYLSAVGAGGLTPVSHVISVGFASEAEAEKWNDARQGTADWNTFVTESGAASEYLGGTLSRTLKQWGPATLADLSP